jgi:hypothetical protein
VLLAVSLVSVGPAHAALLVVGAMERPLIAAEIALSLSFCPSSSRKKGPVLEMLKRNGSLNPS